MRKRSRRLCIGVDFPSNDGTETESWCAGVFAMYPQSSASGNMSPLIRLLQVEVCQSGASCQLDIDLAAAHFNRSTPCVLMLLISHFSLGLNIEANKFLEQKLCWLFGPAQETATRHCLFHLPHSTITNNTSSTAGPLPPLDWLIPTPYITSEGGEIVPLFLNQRMQRPDSFPSIPINAIDASAPRLHIKWRAGTSSPSVAVSSLEKNSCAGIQVATLYHAVTDQPTFSSSKRRDKRHCTYIGTYTDKSLFSCCWCKFSAVPRASQSCRLDLTSVHRAVVVLSHHLRACHSQDTEYEFAIEEGLLNKNEKKSKSNVITSITLHVKVQRCSTAAVTATDQTSSNGKHDAQSERLVPFVYFGGSQRKRWIRNKLTSKEYMRYVVRPYRHKVPVAEQATVSEETAVAHEPQKPIRRYHTMHGIPLDHADNSHGRDDDNERATIDETWKVVLANRLVDEFEDVNSGEKHLMKLWNQHVAQTPVFADMYMGDVSVLFARRYADILKTNNLQKVLLLHLTNMWRLSLITKEHIDKCMGIVNKFHDTL